MRRIACLLLTSAALCAQELPAIARVVAEREKKTFPFVVEYRVDDEVFPENSFSARLATDGERGAWQAQMPDWTPTGKPRWYDLFYSWNRARALKLMRREPDGVWEGDHFTHSTAPTWFNPLQLIARDRLSTWLKHGDTRVAGSDAVGGFDCVVLRCSPGKHEFKVWLSKAHGYFPVQIIRFGPPRRTWKRVQPILVVGGKQLVPTGWWIVDALAPFGDAWVPSSGRMLHCHEEAGAMRLSVEMATATVTDTAFAWPTPRRFLDAKTGKTITHGVPRPFDWSSLRFALWGLVPALLVLGWSWRRRRSRPRSK